MPTLAQVPPFRRGDLLRSLRRWVDLLSLGVVSGLVLVGFSRALRLIQGQVEASIGLSGPWDGARTVYLGLGAAALLLLYFPARGRVRGLLGYRWFVNYPPLWVGIAAGLSTLAWFDAPLGPQLPPGWIAALALALPVGAAAGGAGQLGSRFVAGFVRRRVPDTQPTAYVRKPFLELRSWIDDDRPIDRVRDCFGHATVALRIAERLRAGQSDTVALVGPPGSGKTSICKMAQVELSGCPDVLCVHLSLWPFAGADAAVRGVLEAILSEVGRNTSVVQVAGVPLAYARVVASAPRIGFLGSIVRPDLSPKESLDEIANILEAAGVRLVLFVEDIDRMSVPDRDHGLNPLRALLYLLDQSPAISVVMSNDSSKGFDAYKLARFVERPPSVAANVVSEIICDIRTACRGGWPFPVLPSVPSNSHRALDSVCDGVSGFRRMLGSERPLWPAEALCSIARTPRDLKNGLREAIQAWSRLAGEVDLDCLLVGSILKVHAPAVVSAIDDHITDLRADLSGGRLPGRQTPAHERPAAKAIAGAIGESPDSDAVKVLVEFLFPGIWPNVTATLMEPQRTQAFLTAQPTDYWTRFMGQVPPAADQGDQQFLALLSDSSRRDELVERLDTCGARLVQFRSLTKLQDLAPMLASAVQWDARTMVDGLDKESFGHVRARRVQAVWWLAMEWGRPVDGLADIIISSIEASLAANLPVVADMVDFFTTTESSQPSVLAATDVESCRRAVEKQLVEQFGAKEAGAVRLAAALKGGSPWRILHLVWGLDKIRSKSNIGIPFEGWPQLADSLLHLARVSPDVGVPILLTFVSGQSNRLDGESDAVFLVDAAETLFDRDSLAAVFAENRGLKVAAEFDARLSATVGALVS